MALNIYPGAKRIGSPAIILRAADEHNVSALFTDHRPGVAAGREACVSHSFSSRPVLGHLLPKNHNREPLDCLALCQPTEANTCLKPMRDLCSVIETV